MLEPAFRKDSYHITPQQLPIFIITILFVLAYVLHAVFQQTSWAWLILAGTTGVAIYIQLHKELHIWLVGLGVALMILTPVNTHISVEHCFLMTVGMFSAVILPYTIARRYCKKSFIHFDLDVRRKWSRQEIGYILFAVIGTVITTHLYFMAPDAHQNWPLGSLSDIVIVFVAIMAIGIWEEFFFIATVYGILQRILPYSWAIILQAILFTAFLYQIGFTGWIVLLSFMYAIFQAYVFHKTKTLLLTLIIHVFVDLALFINLFMAAHPF